MMLVELHSTDRADVQRRFRSRYRVVPFVREAFVARPSDSPEVFAREADRHPVFEVTTSSRRGRQTKPVQPHQSPGEVQE